MKNNILLLIILLIFSCQEQEARRPLNVRTHSVTSSTLEQMKRINATADQEIEQYMISDSTQTYINSQNGFWYAVLKKSNQKEFPKSGQQVTFDMSIQDLSDHIVYSKEELGVQSYLIDKQELVSGLQNGLKLMNAGDQFKFLIPSYSAYGIVGDRNRIKSNQSIIAIVTLLNIKSTL